MIYDNIEFFNVAELQEVRGGMRLQRFPREVYENLDSTNNSYGRRVAQHSTGCEIRFVTESSRVSLYLSTMDQAGEVLVYKGDFFHSRHEVRAGIIEPINLENPPRFLEVSPDAFRESSFSNNVWRVIFNRYSLIYHGIETYNYSVRPPREEEVPSIRILNYGSSTTHGEACYSFEDSYVQQASKRLGIDSLCLGMSGSCFAEKSMADFIVNRTDWDIATLEIGVNMRQFYSPEEYEKRVSYLIESIIRKHPHKLIVMLSIFANYADFYKDTPTPGILNNEKFRIIFKDLFEKYKNANLIFLDETQVLTKFRALSTDLLHPSAFGHSLMGESLARAIAPYVNNLKATKRRN